MIFFGEKFVSSILAYSISTIPFTAFVGRVVLRGCCVQQSNAFEAALSIYHADRIFPPSLSLFSICFPLKTIHFIVSHFCPQSFSNEIRFGKTELRKHQLQFQFRFQWDVMKKNYVNRKHWENHVHVKMGKKNACGLTHLGVVSQFCDVKKGNTNRSGPETMTKLELDGWQKLFSCNIVGEMDAESNPKIITIIIMAILIQGINI